MINESFDRIIVVCNASSQPRIHKRVNVLSKIINTKVFGFKRKYYSSNKFNSSTDYTSLGFIENGRYFNRIYKLVQAWRVISLNSESNDGLYAFGIDCFLIGKLAGIKFGIVELGDLRFVNRPSSFMARLERYILSKANKIVITSPYFYESYFKEYGFEKNKFIVLENKLPENHFTRPSPVSEIRDGGKINIGLIGYLRYKEPIEFIIRFVESNSDRYTLQCYGDGPFSYLISDSACESITFHGEFISPGDLREIYSNIDINYICYEQTDENVKIAIPNKYYESIFFNKPIICSKGTALASEVLKDNIGKSLDFSRPTQMYDDLKAIDQEFIRIHSINCGKIPTEKLFDDAENKIRTLDVKNG